MELGTNIRWIIKSVVAGSPEAARANEFGTDLILVDAPEPGSGKIFDWSLVDAIPAGVRLILAGGLNPDNVVSAIEAVQPWGVDVSSGVEASVGRKDPVKVRRFIANARSVARPEFEGDGGDIYDWLDE